MNGFADHGLDEGSFGEKSGISVRAFDAFPKTKASYQTQSHSGGVWTVIMVIVSALLGYSELHRWWIGHTAHAFSVEKGVSHELQINLDMVVAMHCDDLRVNVQDAAGDRILAGETLKRDNTLWSQWTTRSSHTLGKTSSERNAHTGDHDYEEEDVHDFLGASRNRKGKFTRTPSLRGNVHADACRMYGTLQLNKVQGDFHIMARGHGYAEFGMHLEHGSFNFSHIINELSFGPFYPSLTNPLDETRTTTDEHFWKYQYYLSIVPTVYTTDSRDLDGVNPITNPASSDEALDAEQSRGGFYGMRASSRTIFTNQYAVTEQSHPVPEAGAATVPGIFFKYDMEPILLTIAEEWDGWLAVLVRLVNVISGVLVAGGWCYQMTDWTRDVLRKGRRRAGSTYGGVLHGRTPSMDEKRAF